MARWFHLPDAGSDRLHSMPWWVSEAWRKERGRARRDLCAAPIPLLWIPEGNVPPEFDLATCRGSKGIQEATIWSGSADGDHRGEAGA